MTTEHPAGAGRSEASAVHHRLPPVAQLCVASMALIIAGGIYIAAHLPTHVPLGPSTGLLIAAAALLLVNVAALLRTRGFAWDSFRTVGKWAGLGYLAVGGMLEFIFAFDHTRGAALVLVTLSLLVFSANIALLLAFSVARYQGTSTA